MVTLSIRNNNRITKKEEEEDPGVQKKKTIQGMQLGKYQVGRTLGEGNFGKVKLAQDIQSGKPYAVKIIEKNRIISLNITDQVSIIPSPFFFIFLIFMILF